MEAVFLKMLNISITASWIALAVIVIRLLLKKAPKWITVLMWGLVGIRLIFPFSLESVFSLIPSAETIPGDILYTDTPTIHSGIEAFDSVLNPIISQSLAPEIGVSVNPAQVIACIASIIWLAGIAAMLIYTAASYIKMHRKVREAISYRGNIRLCDHVDTPFILGIIRPRIYLPSSMNEPELKYVIAHETAHLKRLDHWWKPLGFLLLTVYWFHPLLWAAYILFCQDIELACDEKVLQNIGVKNKKPYSNALINCSAPHRIIAACPLAFGEISVKKRIEAVLHYKKPAFWITFLTLMLCAAVSVCFLTTPIAPGDHLMLANHKGPAGTNHLAYDIQLGKQVMSGEIYIEQWIDGTCVQSAPVAITRYVDSIDISMRERHEKGIAVGMDVQLETNRYGGSLLSYFPHPETRHVLGHSFTGYKLNQKIQLEPGKEVILAAMAFDYGNGVRTVDCDALVTEPERLHKADYMIIVRAVFHSEPLSDTNYSEASPQSKLSPHYRTVS